MESKGKIGVVIPAVVDSLESELLDEIYNIACKAGYDTIVFTNSSNSFDSFAENEYVNYEEKIYELLSVAGLDGILFAGGRFYNSGVIKHITEIIKKSGIPCVTLEMQQNDFPYVYPSQREDIFAVTEHLITVHGYEKIYCLTGPQNSYEAEERLVGFQSAMRHYGLDENNYSYGDFWKISPAALADDIIKGKIEMPEAVVCTNDTMAVYLCNELKANGIKIPEQIAVTGYDGNFEALSYEPSITTVIHKQKELAFRAFRKLSEIININFNQQMNERKYNIKYGESCGCLPKRINLHRKIQYNLIQNKNLQELYLNSNLMVRMSQDDNLNSFTKTISGLTYLIPNLRQLDICLKSDFPYGRTSSCYTEKMTLVFSNGSNPAMNNNNLFDIKNLLPSLSKKHNPQFIVLLPVHYNSVSFGYMAMYYENAANYHVDTFLQYWRDSLANGLNTISSRMNIVSDTDQIKLFLDSSKNNILKNHITEYSVQLKKIRKELYTSPQLDWTSEILAGKLGISDGYFRRIYKSEFKISFKEDHINARINKAKTLLSHTNLTVSEISSDCGFNNVSHFMRIFKAKSGKTALQFRKGHCFILSD